MKILIALAAAVALTTGCDAVNDLAADQASAHKDVERKIGRTIVRDASNGELDQWSDQRIDDAAGDICELLRSGKAMDPAAVYLQLNDDELQGTSKRSVAVLFTYAQRYEC